VGLGQASRADAAVGDVRAERDFKSVTILDWRTRVWSIPMSARSGLEAEGFESSGECARSDYVGPVDISVVIPTFNRRTQLLRSLEALNRQSLTTAAGRSFAFEVLVVSDGSTDGTADAVNSLTTSFPMRLIEQENGGPGSARNAGVDASSAPIVLFIDDDVVPEAHCVSSHVARHDERDALVVIGPMLTPHDAHLSSWVDWEQFQLEKQYDYFRSHSDAAHVHFYTGNASVPRAAVLEAGGFDTNLARAEDIELAYRLAQGGLSFVVELEARAYHYAERSYDSWIRTAYAYGYNNVEFARMGRLEYWTRVRNDFLQLDPRLRMFILAVQPRPKLAGFLSGALRRSADLAYGLRLRRASRRMLSGSYGLAHATGSVDAMGSTKAFRHLVRCGTRPGLDLVAIFLLEQTLGHVTHSSNLESLVPAIEGVTPVFLPVEAVDDGLTAHLPGLSNWTVRAAINARRALRRSRSVGDSRDADVMFVHTQVPAVLLGGWMTRIPTVVSIDATPMQYDTLGEFYAHKLGSDPVEGLKKRLNVRCFRRAKHIVAWSKWAKASLADDYGVDPSVITVIPPGVDIERWQPARGRAASAEPLRVLFVGGDLHRKGGDMLIETIRTLRKEPDLSNVELHLVTGSDVPSEPGIVVHRNLVANSVELIDRYHQADIFCLPTLGDCLPMVLAEAAACGLPLISTNVGAIGEIVQDHRTGLLIPPGDQLALQSALREMLLSAELRRSLGLAARELAEREHDARRNAARIVELLRAVAVGLPTS
jgi:glycosyltransferase involved in cell wall biosynthesis